LHCLFSAQSYARWNGHIVRSNPESIKSKLPRKIFKKKEKNAHSITPACPNGKSFFLHTDCDANELFHEKINGHFSLREPSNQPRSTLEPKAPVCVDTQAKNLGGLANVT
jgi:hypothetical protein